MKTKWITLLVMLFILEVNSQSEEFDKHFKAIKEYLLVDDITVKYSKNNLIKYQLILDNIKNSHGVNSLVVNNESEHVFRCIGKFKLYKNDCYLISHKALLDKGNDYYAYLIIFNKHGMIEFRTVYSNSNSGFDEHKFGVIFNKNGYSMFSECPSLNKNYKIENNGFIFESEEEFEFGNLCFTRSIPYSLNLNKKFYIEDKVLIPITMLCGNKTSQILRNIGGDDILLKQVYFIDKTEENNIFYLNSLNSNFSSKIYEVIQNSYNDDWIWLNNKSISKYYELSKDIEVIKDNIITNYDNKINRESPRSPGAGYD